MGEARITVAGAMGMAMAVWGALSGALYGEPYSCGPFLLQPASEQMTVVIDHAMPLAAKLTYSRADNQGATPVVVEHEAAARQSRVHPPRPGA